MKESSANVEQEQHAQANNSDVLTSSFETVSESGGETKEDKTLLLSRELAVKLNPKKADFNGALILYGLYLWQSQKVKPFAYTPIVGGKRGCYQSLSELQAEYPWLSEEGIRKSLWHAAGVLGKDFVVDAENPGAVRGKLHFYLSPLLIKKYGFKLGKPSSLTTAKGLIGLSKLDAMKHGVLEAILLHNLRYVTHEGVNDKPLRDDRGLIYREISPTRLTKVRETKDGELEPILPVSREAVSKALTALKNASAIQEHPKKKGFYRILGALEPVIKVADSVNKVASPVNRVARQNEGVAIGSPASLDPRPIVESSDSNTNSNADRKCIFPSTVSRCSTAHGVGSLMSSHAKKLMELVNESMEASRQKCSTPVATETLEQHKSYDLLDHDQARFAGYELMYDSIGLEDYSGKVYSRKAELEEFISQIVDRLQWSHWKYTKNDLKRFEELFDQNPLLTAEDLLAVMNHTPWVLGYGYVKCPKRGHDEYHVARRVKGVRQFFRYLPQLIREYAAHDLDPSVGYVEWSDRGGPIFAYSELPRPLLDIAFGPECDIPITRKSEMDEYGDYVLRPIYYPEFVGMPFTEHVNHDSNPVLVAA